MPNEDADLAPKIDGQGHESGNQESSDFAPTCHCQMQRAVRGVAAQVRGKDGGWGEKRLTSTRSSWRRRGRPAMRLSAPGVWQARDTLCGGLSFRPASPPAAKLQGAATILPSHSHQPAV